MRINNTFWKLITSSEIVIPTIQRDYAYGRKDSKNILHKLLKDIKNELEKKEQGHLHLAFVYGKLEGKKDDEIFKRNADNIKDLLKSVKEYAENMDILLDFDINKGVRQSNENVIFIPIDGQQRLTTLYLLHLYFALHLETKQSKAYLETLKKFKYASRITSKEFCNMLCSIIVNESKLENIKIGKEFIINNEDFFKQWSNDPTVNNMLEVIDEINLVFKDKNNEFENYLNILTQTDVICFDFFDLNRFQLTDDLYVKMNSRGKPLSQLEKFKAWFYVKKQIKDNDGIKKLFDIQWNDIFWNAKKDVKSDIDIAYMQWFKNLFLPIYICSDFFNSNLEDDKEGLEYYISDTKSIIGTIRNPSGKFLDLLETNENLNKLFIDNIDLNKLDVIAFNHQNDVLYSNEISKEYILNLRNISINKSYYPDTIEHLLFTEQPDLNWWHVTFQFAVIQYITSFVFNEIKLNRYLRVISNLIFNTPINGPANYKSSIESIKSIVESLNNFDGCIISLLNNSTNKFRFFSEEQQNEEILKASKYMQLPNSNDWELKLIEAENYHYFYGQIGFLFELLNSKDSIHEFDTLLQKMKNIFSKQVLIKADNFLFRGLLSIIGDILFIKEDKIWRFPINDDSTLRTRNENWRSCLLKKDKIFIFKNIIENNKFESIEASISYLEELINNFNNENSYLDLIIKNEKLLNDSLKHCIWVFNETKNIVYTMNRTSIRGYYRELYTMDWYLQNSQNYTLKYPSIAIFVKGLMHEVDNDCGLNVEYSNQGILNFFTIYRNYKDSNFKLLKKDDLYNQDGIFTSSSIDELIENIINNKNGILN